MIKYITNMAARTLVINPFGIGDVLFSTPLLRTIKKEFPEGYIGYICNIRTKEILETNPDISEVFVFERGEYRALWKRSKIRCLKKLFAFWEKIKKRNFDIVLDLSLGKEYAFLCWLAGIKERRGFNYKGRGRFLTRKVPFDGFNDRPVTEYYLDLLGSRLGTFGASPEQYSSSEVEKDIVSTVLIPTDTDIGYVDNFLKESGVKEGGILIGIAPGGGVSFGTKDQERRRWGVEKFSELADRIIEDFGAELILIWGPGEKGLAEEIKALMRHQALIAPKTTIRQMAALCKRCKIVICSEGGPLHIASSQGIKTVSIFGPVDEKVYGPYPPSDNNIVIASGAACRPCYKHFKLPECSIRECLDGISVDTVFNAISSRLGS